MARCKYVIPSLLASLVLLTGIVGCGGDPGDGFSGDRGHVSGTITLDDKPLMAGCQVMFISATGSYTASGVVNSEGKYTLAYSDSRGLPAVEYLVQLTAPIVADSTTTVDPMEMASKMQLGQGENPVVDSRPFPLMYESTTTSTLTFKVGPNENVADFKLVSAQ